jgi:hypothetical protein
LILVFGFIALMIVRVLWQKNKEKKFIQKVGK